MMRIVKRLGGHQILFFLIALSLSITARSHAQVYQTNFGGKTLYESTGGAPVVFPTDVAIGQFFTEGNCAISGGSLNIQKQSTEYCRTRGAGVWLDASTWAEANYRVTLDVSDYVSESGTGYLAVYGGNWAAGGNLTADLRHQSSYSVFPEIEAKEPATLVQLSGFFKIDGNGTFNFDFTLSSAPETVGLFIFNQKPPTAEVLDSARFKVNSLSIDLAPPPTSISTYYVAPDGSDSANGSLNSPFLTIQHAVNQAGAGDTIYARQGLYREQVIFPVDGLGGYPITLQSYPGETATLSGAEPLNATWTQHSGSIYKTTTDAYFEQLWANDLQMIEARWPNADAEKLYAAPQARLPDETASDFNTLYSPELPPGDWTGGTIMVSPRPDSSTYSRIITNYVAGEKLDYDHPVPDIPQGKNPYHLFGALAGLDVEKEWHLDEANDTLYLYAPGGVDPSTLSIEIKQRLNALELSNRSYIEIVDLRVLGAGIMMKNSSHCTIRNLVQRWPDKIREIENRIVPATGLQNYMSGSYNSWINCEITDASTACIYNDSSTGNSVINCYLANACQIIGKYGALKSTTTADARYERNTMENTGKFVIHHAIGTLRAEFRYNHLRNGGQIHYNDGGICYGSNLSGEDNSHHSYNWYYNYGPSEGSGLYWDDNGRRCIAHHNVAWDVYTAFRANTKTDYPNGDEHRLYNNTALTPDGQYYATYYNPAGDATRNKQTGNEFLNNLGEGFSKLETVFYDFSPADMFLRNAFGDAGADHVVDRSVLDFRPKANAPIVDAGEVVVGFTESYEGAAPDHGAYEYGSPSYWIPGRKTAQASTAIPYSGATDMPLDRDLIYLIGYEGVSAKVYFGTANNDLNLLGELDDPNNVVDLDDYAVTLAGDTTYYWRVDTVLADSSVVTGEVWSFTTMMSATVLFAENFEGTVNRTADFANNNITLNTDFEIGEWTYSALNAGNNGDLVSVDGSMAIIKDSNAAQRGMVIAIDASTWSSGTLNLRFKSTHVSGASNVYYGIFSVNSNANPVVDLGKGAGDFANCGVPNPVVSTYKPMGLFAATGTTSTNFTWTAGEADTLMLVFTGDQDSEVALDDFVIDVLAASSPALLYANWLADFPTLGSFTNATDNPDGDALNNLGEYALGGIPTNGSDIGIELVFHPLEGEADWFDYTYAIRKDAEARGLTYEVETNTDLTDALGWTNAHYEVMGTNTAYAAGFDAVTNRVSTMTETNLFIRLKIQSW